MATVIPIKEYGGRYYVDAQFVVDGQSLGVVHFLVDTGATHTFITPNDEVALVSEARARRIEFDVRAGEPTTVGGIGGPVSVIMLTRQDMLLRLRGERAHTTTEILKSVYFVPRQEPGDSPAPAGCLASIFGAPRANRRQTEDARPTKISDLELGWSILGMDVLGSFAMIFLPANDNAFLIKFEGTECNDFVRNHLDVPGSPLHTCFHPPRARRDYWDLNH